MEVQGMNSFNETSRFIVTFPMHQTTNSNNKSSATGKTSTRDFDWMQQMHL